MAAVRLSRAVVIGNDRHHTVIQTEHRHEDEALQLEIDAEDGGRRRGEGNEDLVESEVHHRADGHHDDRRNAHAVDFLHRVPVEADMARANADVWVIFEVHPNCQNRRDNLTDDRGKRRAGNLHARKTEPAENQDRVQNDIDHRAGDLCVHRKLRPPRRLQQPLEAELRENADGRAETNRGVACAVFHNLRNVRLRQEEGS